MTKDPVFWNIRVVGLKSQSPPQKKVHKTCNLLFPSCDILGIKNVDYVQQNSRTELIGAVQKQLACKEGCVLLGHFCLKVLACKADLQCTPLRIF